MRKTLGLFAALFSLSTFAEVPIAPPPVAAPIVVATPVLPTTVPACASGVTNLTLYRCGCRLNVTAAGGNTQSSIPLMMNGSYVVYSAAALTGSCQGTIPPQPCNPAALNGQAATGTYSCASVSTSGADGGTVSVNW